MNAALQTFILNMIKNSGIDPEWVKGELVKVVKISVQVRDQMNRIEMQNAEILRHLIEGEQHAESRSNGYPRDPAILTGPDHSVAECPGAGHATIVE